MRGRLLFISWVFLMVDDRALGKALQREDSKGMLTVGSEIWSNEKSACISPGGEESEVKSVLLGGQDSTRECYGVETTLHCQTGDQPEHGQPEDWEAVNGCSSGWTVTSVAKYATAAAVGGTAAVALAPVVVASLGFTAGGIAANSIAAGMMSTAAAANGGTIASASIVAGLQSIGAAGLTTAGASVVAGAGAAAGSAVTKLGSMVLERQESLTNGVLTASSSVVAGLQSIGSSDLATAGVRALGGAGAAVGSAAAKLGSLFWERQD